MIRGRFLPSDKVESECHNDTCWHRDVGYSLVGTSLFKRLAPSICLGGFDHGPCQVPWVMRYTGHREPRGTV